MTNSRRLPDPILPSFEIPVQIGALDLCTEGLNHTHRLESQHRTWKQGKDFPEVAITHFLLCTLYLWCLLANAAQVYVSTSGNDSIGTGTIGNPYRTIAKGASTLSSGDSLIMRGAPAVTGIYEEGAILDVLPSGKSPDQPTKVIGYPGEKALFKPTTNPIDAVAFCIGYDTKPMRSNIWFEGFSIDSINGLGKQTSVIFVRHGANITVTNMTFLNANYHNFIGAQQAGCNGLYILNNLFTNWANKDALDPPHAIYVKRANNVIIRGNTLIAENITPKIMTSAGIHCYDAKMPNGWGTNVLIEGNFIKSSRFTLSIHNLVDGHIRNNILVSTSTAHRNLQFYGSLGVRFDNNIVYGGLGGIYINQYASSRDHVFRNNIIWGQAGASVEIHPSVVDVSFYTNNIMQHPPKFPGATFAGGGNMIGSVYDPGISPDVHSDSIAFRPQPSSSAREAGINLFSQFTADIDGNTRRRSGPWDIGAFEYRDARPQQVAFVVSLEARDALILTSDMVLSEDQSLARTLLADSAEPYIVAPYGERGWAHFHPTLVTAGHYTIWCRVYATDPQADSFHVAINGKPLGAFEANLWAPVWQWVRLTTRHPSDPQKVATSHYFNSSVNELSFGGRDANTLLSRVLITNDPDFVPAEAAASRVSLQIRKTSYGSVLKWPSTPGTTYRVFHSPDFSRSPWTAVGEPVEAVGLATEWLAPKAESANGFYWVHAGL